MEKISITVKIPALDSTYDFIVPNNIELDILYEDYDEVFQ